VDRYVLHQRGWNGDRCRCNCNSFRALVARGGISANCSQEPSIGIRPLVAQARRKLALATRTTNWRGPSCYRAASRIALICWTDGFAEAGSRDIGARGCQGTARKRLARRSPARVAHPLAHPQGIAVAPQPLWGGGETPWPAVSIWFEVHSQARNKSTQVMVLVSR
jgi:hypothetical protein